MTTRVSTGQVWRWTMHNNSNVIRFAYVLNLKDYQVVINVFEQVVGQQTIDFVAAITTDYKFFFTGIPQLVYDDKMANLLKMMSV